MDLNFAWSIPKPRSEQSKSRARMPVRKKNEMGVTSADISSGVGMWPDASEPRMLSVGILWPADGEMVAISG